MQGITVYLAQKPDYVLDKPNKKIYLDTTPELFARYEIFFLELIRRHFHELVGELNGVPLHNPAVGLYESFLRALN